MAAKKGARAQEILQTLARMLETSKGRISNSRSGERFFAACC